MTPLKSFASPNFKRAKKMRRKGKKFVAIKVSEVSTNQERVPCIDHRKGINVALCLKEDSLQTGQENAILFL